MTQSVPTTGITAVVARQQTECKITAGAYASSSLADGTDLIPLIYISGLPGEGPVAGRRIPKR